MLSWFSDNFTVRTAESHADAAQPPRAAPPSPAAPPPSPAAPPQQLCRRYALPVAATRRAVSPPAAAPPRAATGRAVSPPAAAMPPRAATRRAVSPPASVMLPRAALDTASAALTPRVYAAVGIDYGLGPTLSEYSETATRQETEKQKVKNLAEDLRKQLADSVSQLDAAHVASETDSADTKDMADYIVRRAVNSHKAPIQFWRVVEGMCNMRAGELAAHDEAEINKTLQKDLTDHVNSMRQAAKRDVQIMFSTIEKYMNDQFETGNTTLEMREGKNGGMPSFVMLNDQNLAQATENAAGLMQKASDAQTLRYKKLQNDIRNVRTDDAANYARISFMADPLNSGILLLGPLAEAALWEAETVWHQYFESSPITAEYTDKGIGQFFSLIIQSASQRSEARRNLAVALSELIKGNVAAFPDKYLPSTVLVRQTQTARIKAVQALGAIAGQRAKRRRVDNS